MQPKQNWIKFFFLTLIPRYFYWYGPQLDPVKLYLVESPICSPISKLYTVFPPPSWPSCHYSFRQQVPWSKDSQITFTLQPVRIQKKSKMPLGKLTLLTAVVLVPQLAFPQCVVKQIIQKEMGLNLNMEPIVLDSILFHFDESGDLVSSESHLQGPPIPTILQSEFISENGEVVKEKIITDLDWYPLEYFPNRIPFLSCKERIAVNTAGDVLAREDMSKDFYGIKTWEGIDQNNQAYATYEMGRSDQNKILLYKQEKFNGAWAVSSVKILTQNEHGDLIQIQEVTLAGFGYVSESFSYVYNDCGIWVEKKRIARDGKEYLAGIQEVVYWDE